MKTLSHEKFIEKFGYLDLNGYTKGLSTELGDLKVLVTLCRYFKCERALELGVRYGHTALYVLRHCPDLKQYVGIDVPYNFKTVKKVQQPEVPVQVGIVASQDKRFQGIALPGGTQDLVGKESSLGDPFDFIFIDADHSLEGVIRDTQIVFKLVKNGGIIVWHDYSNEKDITLFLDDLSKNEDLIHVEGSMCCFLQKT